MGINSKIKLIGMSILLLLLAAPTKILADENSFGHITAEFNLMDSSGAVVTEKDFAGKNILLAFGFTHCKHICPMMAANMGLALRLTNKEAVGIFISVDSERDSPATAHDYAVGFDTSMKGLSGNYQQLSLAANNFGASFVVSKTQKAYTVEHTSDIFLIGPGGNIIDVFALNAPPQSIADAMKTPASP